MRKVLSSPRIFRTPCGRGSSARLPMATRSRSKSCLFIRRFSLSKSRSAAGETSRLYTFVPVFLLSAAYGLLHFLLYFNPGTPALHFPLGTGFLNHGHQLGILTVFQPLPYRISDNFTGGHVPSRGLHFQIGVEVFIMEHHRHLATHLHPPSRMYVRTYRHILSSSMAYVKFDEYRGKMHLLRKG